MNESEHNLTLEEAMDGLAGDTLAAMIRAQKTAARENARYGMSLIVEKPSSQRKAPAKAKKVKRAAKN